MPGTLLALGFAVYVRLQPPTVIRVDADGEAAVLGQAKPSIAVTRGPGSEPTDFEKRAFVRLFLKSYLNFSPANVARNWAEGLNMMTANLRRTAYAAMQKENTIGKIEEDQTRSEFQLRLLQPVVGDLSWAKQLGIWDSADSNRKGVRWTAKRWQKFARARIWR